MMCIAMDLEDFKDDELPSDKFEDLEESDYKLLTQDEASDDKEEEESEVESSEDSAAIRYEQYKGMFTKEENEEFEEYLKIPKKIRKERQRENDRRIF
jgi:hypothetical protein